MFDSLAGRLSVIVVITRHFIPFMLERTIGEDGQNGGNGEGVKRLRTWPELIKAGQGCWWYS